MYIPSPNRIDDPKVIQRFIREHSFATLITQDDGVPLASHLPLIFDADSGSLGKLRGHMARANPQWKSFSKGKVLCIFHGPHAYISPSWYESKDLVPTWNYAVVHVYGTATLVNDPDSLKQLLADTTTLYESDMPQPWTLDLPESKTQPMLQAIVGFSIEISKIEAKFKLGQNRSEEDQLAMLQALSESPNDRNQELSRLIKKHRSMQA